MLSDTMERVHSARKDVLDATIKLLGGVESTDCRLKLPDTFDKVDQLVEESRDLLNEGLNKEGLTVPDRVARYQTAFGLCAVAKSKAVGTGDRIKAAAAWLDTVELIKANDEEGAAFPGCDYGVSS